jgi:ribonuclease HII
MILGDGTSYTGKNRRKVCIYYTVSKKLRDDFEEILLKANWTYHTSWKMLKDRYINKRLIKKENQTPCFEIRLRRNTKAQVKSLHKKEVFYRGKVFCLQLPKYHNFYVRRNGTGYFTGNSLAGPVTAAAVMINSKTCPERSRRVKNQNLKTILRNARDSHALASEKVIDKINIEKATFLAMKKCLKKINLKPDIILIDGNRILDKNLKITQKAIIKGDDKIFSIALASIVAKVTRDRIMKRYHKKYPGYGFDRHKGYPTKYHFKMLKKIGPCQIHRKSYKPIRKIIKNLKHE